MGNQKIRIKDIAQKAGVSTGTVDRVLHDRGNVSPTAREKVMKALEEMDYTPNIIASTLASNKSFPLASLMPLPSSDPYWKLPQMGIEKALQGVGHYGVVLQPYYFDLFSAKDFRKKAEQIMAEDPPEALLVAPIYLEESLWLWEQCQERDLPVIFINTDLEEANALSYIGQDSYQSGVLAGRLFDLLIGQQRAQALLLNLGKETIRNARHLRDKEGGFRSYLESSSLEVVIAEFGDFENQQALKSFTKNLLEEHPLLKGIFVTNSRAHVLLNSTGAILKDVHVVAFDLLPENLAYLQNHRIDFIINQNPVQQGYIGLMTAVNHILFKKPIPRRQHLPLDIVVPENVSYYLEREKEFQLVV